MSLNQIKIDLTPENLQLDPPSKPTQCHIIDNENYSYEILDRGHIRICPRKPGTKKKWVNYAEYGYVSEFMTNKSKN